MVDGLDAVCVVSGIFGIVHHLRVDVDACVDEAEGFDVERDGRCIRLVGGDEIVLLVEVVCGDGAVVASVGLTPDAEAVRVGFIRWESTVVLAKM